MEFINRSVAKIPVKAVLLDFDGTISTLRCGWESVMRGVMLEHIGETPEAKREVDKYISDSTGIQTIHQMKWLAERIRISGREHLDPWDYKDEYNRRLMETIKGRIEEAKRGDREKYLVPGSLDFLERLIKHNVRIYVASGTDHKDVTAEAEALGVSEYFCKIAGASHRSEGCSKEDVIAQLIEEEGLKGSDFAVIGDGKVEIRLGHEAGARTIGLATDEINRLGVNAVKRDRLIAAGADVIAADFTETDSIADFLGLSQRRSRTLDFSGIKTYSALDRHNLVRIDNLKRPGEYIHEAYSSSEFTELVKRIKRAREEGKEIIFSMGAHVIKCGLSPYLISLMKEGYITHLAGNGACSIHDFELAYLGGTSEDVPTAIEDGSFGMWEQTGAWMNEAIKQGARDDMGYGEALGRYIDLNPECFPYRDDCVLYQAYLFDIPATYHVALGTDIIHQHPTADFGAIGKASGIDFKKICASVSRLHRGIYLNFGSAVIGPEVFLKALSISRNLGYPTYDITTANFDLINLGDYRSKIGYNDPNYYYRPRKNIVNRPVSRGGVGYHFCGDHQETLPTMYDLLIEG